MNHNPPPPKGCQPRSEAGETVESTGERGGRREEADWGKAELLAYAGRVLSQPAINLSGWEPTTMSRRRKIFVAHPPSPSADDFGALERAAKRPHRI